MTGLDLPWKLEKLGLAAPAGNLGRPRAMSPPSVPSWCFAGILAAVPAWGFVAGTERFTRFPEITGNRYRKHKPVTIE
jgi:hypothetical protein